MTGELVHATALAVAVDADGPLAGALILGSSGAGKSTLALALIENCPFRRTALVSDDATLLEAIDGRLFATAPQTMAGLIEVRGFGPAPIRAIASVGLVAGFDLDRRSARLPEPESRKIGGGSLPIWPFQGIETGALRLKVILRAILARPRFPSSESGAME
jgi:GTPase SAR1 family protein